MTEQEMFKLLGVDLLARDREQAAKDLEYAQRNRTFLQGWSVITNVSSWNPMYGRFKETGRLRTFGLSGVPAGSLTPAPIDSDSQDTEDTAKKEHREYAPLETRRPMWMCHFRLNASLTN